MEIKELFYINLHLKDFRLRRLHSFPRRADAREVADSIYRIWRISLFASFV